MKSKRSILNCTQSKNSVIRPSDHLFIQCQEVQLNLVFLIFTPQPSRAVRVLFSPMVSGWVGGGAAGKSLSRLYLRNRKV